MIKELVTKRERFSGLTNDLTKEMDQHLIPVIKESGVNFKTYIYDSPIDNKWIIRYPGASRGNIEVDDNNIITKITFYKDECSSHTIYDESVEGVFDKYIGMKLVIL